MEGLADERSVRGFALYVATWAHFLRNAVSAGETVRDASAALVSVPWANGGGGLEAFLNIEEVFGVLSQHDGWRSAVCREFEDITETGLEATLLGYIFGHGHNSNGELSTLAGRAERVSGNFVLDETCVPIAEERADDVVFVPLEA
jgi:mannitol 2-dehydrogenase